MNRNVLERFVRESNMIENITRDPTPDELQATEAFTELPSIRVDDVVALVKVFQPDAVLRDKPGLNVRVGPHIAPRGGPEIREQLEALLRRISTDGMTPYDAHVAYETLHPFMDGNGRSGRAIWLWQIVNDFGTLPTISFLRHWYYMSLQGARDGSVFAGKSPLQQWLSRENP